MKALQDASKLGILRPNVDPLAGALMFFGSISHLMQADAIASRYFGVCLANRTYRRRVVDGTLHIFLNGILAGGEQQT